MTKVESEARTMYVATITGVYEYGGKPHRHQFHYGFVETGRPTEIRQKFLKERLLKVHRAELEEVLSMMYGRKPYRIVLTCTLKAICCAFIKNFEE